MNATSAYPDLVLQFDRPRTAVFNLRAMNALEAFYEKETGEKQLWRALDWRNMGTREMTRILWASLLSDADDNQEQLTYEDVEKFATAASLIESADKFLALVEELFDRAMPAIESGELAKSLESLEKKTTRMEQLKTAKKPPAQTGSNSSASA